VFRKKRIRYKTSMVGEPSERHREVSCPDGPAQLMLGGGGGGSLAWLEELPGFSVRAGARFLSFSIIATSIMKLRVEAGQKGG
jgi:hypothetical protein